MGNNNVVYATLDDVLEEIENRPNGPKTDNRFIMRALYTVSRRIDSVLGSTRPLFAPMTEARIVRIDPHNVNTYYGTLDLDAPLLSLTSLSVNGTALTTSQANVYPSGGYAPYWQLGLADCYAYTWYNIACSGCGRVQNATITGVWGIHRDYANAWFSVDTLSANITDSATTLTVANADGNDYYGLTPRLSPGSIIRIDTEIMSVLAVDVQNNIVTVARAMLGTTAAAHTSTTAVYVFQAEDPIRRVTARQVGLLNSRRGAYNNSQTDMSTGINVTYTRDLLDELNATLDDYQYLGVY